MMWTALNCPQCSAPLPRVALWRAVTCGSCGALIRREGSLVKREDFRQALVRARGEAAAGGGEAIACGGASYALLGTLGEGDFSTVFAARRLGAHPLLATVKISSTPAGKTSLEREAAALSRLRAAQDGGAAVYASLHIPEVIACGAADASSGRHALVLRHAPGYWGSLAALHAVFPAGLDPRHLVWIWRRMLDTLHFLHAQGWTHGAIRPEHALVHAGEHAVRLIGWAAAHEGASRAEMADDLFRSARTVAVLAGANGSFAQLPPAIPAPLRDLIVRAADDADFCGREGARGLDSLLRRAAEEAFGPPAFVPLVLPH